MLNNYGKQRSTTRSFRQWEESPCAVWGQHIKPFKHWKKFHTGYIPHSGFQQNPILTSKTGFLGHYKALEHH